MNAKVYMALCIVFSINACNDSVFTLCGNKKEDSVKKAIVNANYSDFKKELAEKYSLNQKNLDLELNFDKSTLADDINKIFHITDNLAHLKNKIPRSDLQEYNIFTELQKEKLVSNEGHIVCLDCGRKCIGRSCTCLGLFSPFCGLEKYGLAFCLLGFLLDSEDRSKENHVSPAVGRFSNLEQIRELLATIEKANNKLLD